MGDLPGYVQFMDADEWDNPHQRLCDLRVKSLWLIARSKLIAEKARAIMAISHAVMDEMMEEAGETRIDPLPEGR